jgi:hypothetical protein
LSLVTRVVECAGRAAATPFVDCLRNGALLLSPGLLARLHGDEEVAMLVAHDIVAALAPAKPRTREHIDALRAAAGS